MTMELKGFADNLANPGSGITWDLPPVINHAIWHSALAGIISIPGAKEYWKSLTTAALEDLSEDPTFGMILKGFKDGLDVMKTLPKDLRETALISAISMAYAESRFNAKAVNKTIDTPRAPKGYWQLMPRTYAAVADLFNRPNGTYRKVMDKIDLLKEIKGVDPKHAKLVEKVGHPLVVDLENPSTQVIPTVILLLANVKSIANHWKYDEEAKKWIPLITPGNPYILHAVNNAVPGAMEDKELGFQVLMTAYHVNGSGFMKSKNYLSHLDDGGTNRYAVDVSNFLNLRQVIGIDEIDKIFDLS